jgi:alpha-ketoglutarate-dependent taurine dioxygenase
LQRLAAARARIEAEFVRSGAVLLRGFGIAGEAQFQLAAQALTGGLEASYGDLVKRASSQFVYDATVYPRERAILFHNEGSHTPEVPRRQFFFCARNDARGGETPIVDCRQVYRALGSELAERFARQGLCYVRNFIRGVDVRWQDFFRSDDRASVEQRCREHGVAWTWKRNGDLRLVTRAPAVIRHPGSNQPSFFNQLLLHHVACLDARTAAALTALLGPNDLPRSVAFGDGSELPGELVAQVLKVMVEQAVRFAWRPGDVLMLDNLAVAHARSPFEGERQILVAVGDVVRVKDLS